MERGGLYSGRMGLRDGRARGGVARCVGAVLLICAAGVQALPQLNDGYTLETVASGIEFSTDLCFLPPVDGKDRFIVTQKNGLVLVVTGTQVSSTPFVDLRSVVNTHHDRGLSSCAIWSDFPNGAQAFFLYAFEEGEVPKSDPKTGQLARFDINSGGNTVKVASKKILLGTVNGPGCDNIPVEADVICTESFTHATGGMVFDPRGNLFVTTGDGRDNAPNPITLRTMNPNSLNGKVLRITRDGFGVAGNPFFRPADTRTDNRAKVFALGFRNPWRIYFDPFLGKPVVADVGWASREEVNIVPPGTNCGWPCVEGSDLRTGGYSKFAQCQRYGDGNPFAGTVQPPLVAWPHNEGAAASMLMRMTRGNSNWPDKDTGFIYYTDYVFNWMKRIRIDSSGKIVSGPETFARGLDGPVSMRTSPSSKSLYYIALTAREVRKFVYKPDNSLARVDLTNPPNNTANVEVTAQIRVQFSRQMRGQSLERSIALRRLGTLKSIPSTLEYISSTKTAVISPKERLLPRTQYVVRVDTTARDAAGRKLLRKHRSLFTTGTGFSIFMSDLDFTVAKNRIGKPTRDNSSGRGGRPGRGNLISIRGEQFEKGIGGAPDMAVGVTVPAGCTVLEGVVGVDDVVGRLDGGSLKAIVYVNGNKLVETGTLTRQSDIVPFNLKVVPNRPMQITARRVNQKLGASVNLVSWGDMVFRCGQSGSDTAPPTVVNMQSAVSSSGKPVSIRLTLTFSKAMDQASVFNAVRVTVGENTEVPWKPSYPSATTLVLQMELLRYNTEYSVTVGPQARSAGGIRLAAAYTSQFTTPLEPATGLTVPLELLPGTVSFGDPARVRPNFYLRILKRGNPPAVQKFSRGLGVRAPTVIDYGLAGRGCTRFRATVGLGGSVDGYNGRCRVRILGDGEVLAERLFTASMFYKQLDVDIAGRSVVRLSSQLDRPPYNQENMVFAMAHFVCGGTQVFLDTLRPTNSDKGFARNSTINGESLSLRKFPGGSNIASYKSGFRQHANSRFTVDVPGRCSALRSDVGVDVLSQDLAALQLGVGEDGTRKCSTPVMDGTGGVRKFDCPIATTTKRVTLSAFAKGPLVHNIAVWGFPRLICARSALNPRVEIGPLVKRFRIGDVINYSGTAFNFRDQQMNPQQLSWTVILHHCDTRCHIHMFAQTKGSGGSFKVPDHGDVFFFEIIGEACDLAGRCGTTSATTRPYVARLVVKTKPEGLSVSGGPKTGTSPVTFEVVLGSANLLAAPRIQDGLTFSNWEHRSTAAAETTVYPRETGTIEYTAVYRN